jgi:hypothetical protein
MTPRCSPTERRPRWPERSRSGERRPWGESRGVQSRKWGRPKSPAPEESSPNSASIQSVERAADLLRLFVPNIPSLGPTEIAQLSGMSVSTAHRYCSALRKAGLLRYDPATGRYGLGGGCIELGLAAAEAMPIVGLARPLMSEVVAHLDRTAPSWASGTRTRSACWR